MTTLQPPEFRPLALDRLDLYSGMHDAELRFRDQTISSLSPFVGILTGIVGATVFYLRSAPVWSTSGLPLLFYTVISLGGVALSCAIWFVGAALWGYEFSFPADALALEEWFQRELLLHSGDADARVAAEQKLRESLAVQFAHVASANRVLNRRNSLMAFRGKVATIVSVVLFGLGLIPLAVLALKGAGHSSSAASTETIGGTRNDESDRAAAGTANSATPANAAGPRAESVPKPGQIHKDNRSAE